jgi:hypothetical protein
MPKTGAPIVTASGRALPNNPARADFAVEALRKHNYSTARAEIMKRFKVSKATAERDIRAAKQLIAGELDALEVRAAEVMRLSRIADRAEEIADKLATRAADAADYAAVASLHKAAISASREVSRLTGAIAPKKIDVTHKDAVDLPLQLDDILSELDEEGHAALAVVLDKIEAAKSAGRLLPRAPADEDVIEDAELVEDDAAPKPSTETN